MKLNDFEQHRTATQYEDRLMCARTQSSRAQPLARPPRPAPPRPARTLTTAARHARSAKQFIFQFVNSYFSLFYIAFVKASPLALARCRR